MEFFFGNFGKKVDGNVRKPHIQIGVALGLLLTVIGKYSIMLTYHFAMNYPIQTYFEYTALVIQDLILILTVLYYSDEFGFHIVPLFALYFFAYTGLAYRFVPDFILLVAIWLTTPISASSKLLQIISLYKHKDAGNLSAATWGIATYGTVVRSITTLMQTGDIAVLVNFVTSASLNLTLCTMVLYYQSTKKKKLY